MATIYGAKAAVIAELKEEQREGDGAWVARGDEFVQWCRDERGALELLEVQPGKERDRVLPVLLGQGFAPHGASDLAEIGMLEYVGPPLARSGEDDEVVDVLLGLLKLLGADEDSELEVYH